MDDRNFYDFINEDVPMNHNIQKYMMVTRNKLREYGRIAVSYSGGSDSDIMLDMIELIKPYEDCGKIRYTFFDTSLEYDATHRHITEVEQKYGVTIERIKSKKSIPAACREHGIPFISKEVSEWIDRLQRHDFDWSDTSENATKVQQRIGILIDQQRFLTPQELAYLHEQAQEQEIETAAPPRTVNHLWQSYENIAEKYPGNILFFKVGDFYEVMGDDAHTVAQVLNLAVASRDVGLPERVPLVGLPHHSFTGYVKQLIESSHTVAVAESVSNVREHGKPSIDTPDTQTLPDVADKAPTLQPQPQNQPTTQPTPQPTPQPQADLTNFRIADPHLGEGGAKTKYAYNIAATKTLQAIESENRLATPEEQEVLSRFVGWGGLQEAFDESKTGWAKEYQELKSLLSPEEYTAARTSVLNAHYTSPTVISAMYETLERMGVNGGNILEPSMGVGNFFGLMPESMQNAKLYGVELDSVSGRIAKQLYQNADIKVTGFEKTTMPDSFFDVAVGNVPFGGFGVVDKKYDKHKFMIHDYFFAKTLDQVRPGGIVAFVTSKGTLDKANPAVRKYLAQRADLLGAVRLPSNAFLKNAGTEVTSDIIFLQKRDSIRDIEPPWVHLRHIEDALNPEQNIAVNSYFVDNPHMILGNMTAESGTRMYGNEKSTSCLPIEGADLGEQLKTALSHIEGQITPLDIGLSIRDAGDIDILEVGTAAPVLPADPAVKNFSYTIVDNNVYFRENSIMRPVDMPAVTLERVKGMVGLRDAAKQLIDLQLYDGSDLQIATKQAELNSLYDDFTKKFAINPPRPI